MAVRLHVTAIRRTDKDRVRKVYNEVLGDKAANIELHEANGWTWFLSSVWAVGSHELLKGPELLDVPAIVFTTQDACRWIASFYVPDQNPSRYAVVHEFYGELPHEEHWTPSDEEEEPLDPELEFLFSDEQPQEQTPQTAFDAWIEEQQFVGGLYPEALIQECRALPFAQAVEHIDRWQYDRLRTFIAAEHLGVDWEKIEATLRWQGLSEAEHHADIGNLPRLLSLLKLNGQWDQWVADAEARSAPSSTDNGDEVDDEEDDDEQEGGRTYDVEALKELCDTLPRLDIRGGPTPLRLDRLYLLQFIPQSCADTYVIHVMLALTLPKDTPTGAAELASGVPRKMPDGWCQSESRRFLLGGDPATLLYPDEMQFAVGVPADEFWRRVPEGTRLEVVFGDGDAPDARQLYSGTIRDGDWYIDRASIALDADAIQDALRLADAADEESDIRYVTARDESEVEQVLKSLQADPFLRMIDVKRQGLKLAAGEETEQLAATLFRLRYRGLWPITEHEAEDGDAQADDDNPLSPEQQSELRRRLVESARATMAVRIGKPLYHGRTTVFFRSDLSHFGELDDAPRQQFASAMREKEYQLLGDMTSKRFRDFVLRCYVAPDDLCYATLTASRMGYLFCEYTSRFSDGSLLTTTTSSMVDSHPTEKVYYADYFGLSPQELLDKHRSKFKNFREHKHAEPMHLVGSLKGVAELFDEFLLRVERAASAIDFRDGRAFP